MSNFSMTLAVFALESKPIKNKTIMKKEKYLEAKKQYDIIEACQRVFEDNKDDEIKLMFPINIEVIKSNIYQLVFSDKQVTRSFLRWVENEKKIAEQKLVEL